jgi:hypothetical protein
LAQNKSDIFSVVPRSKDRCINRLWSILVKLVCSSGSGSGCCINEDLILRTLISDDKVARRELNPWVIGMSEERELNDLALPGHLLLLCRDQTIQPVLRGGVAEVLGNIIGRVKLA